MPISSRKGERKGGREVVRNRFYWECNLEGVSWKGTKSVQGEVDDPEVGETGELAELQTLNLVGVEVDDLDVGQAELLHVGDLVVVQPEDM